MESQQLITKQRMGQRRNQGILKLNENEKDQHKPLGHVESNPTREFIALSAYIKIQKEHK